MLLSTLLGLDPPALPTARLVATAGLFGISEGTARVALSRMAAAGEVVADDGRYRLAGRLLDRQRRQASGLHPPDAPWAGGWHLAVVTAGRRSALERGELRAALAGGRLAEWREGVWTRPDNLPTPVLAPRLAGHAAWLAATPDLDPTALAATLWDLEGWATTAGALVDRLTATQAALDAGDTDALAPGFVLSAAVLRHLAGDPLLPAELLPGGWPGPILRQIYERWDAAYRAVLAGWHRAHP
ncbi:MAG: transcriptional regulator PaaX family [Actinomycetia bacterium]|nr:transcriptional regulator PaaX family [Actinomycetes bacterium]